MESWSHPFKREDPPWVRVGAERYGRELDIIEAAQGLIATIDIIDSGMTVIPFDKVDETLYAAVDRLRAATEAYQAEEGQDDVREPGA